MGLTSIFSGCCCSTLIFGGILCIAAMYLFRRRIRNFPPGPRGIPVVGYTPFLGDHAAESIRKLKSKYGPVMSLQLGMEDWVVLNDFQSINDCLVKQGEKFSGRPKNQILDVITWGMGIAFSDYGKTWKQLRKFGLMTLRGFGVGKKGMEENVIEETPYLIDELIKSNGKQPVRTLTDSISNIICRVIFGSRFDYDDKKFSALTRIFRDFFSESSDIKLFGVMTVAPFLRHFPVFRGAIKRIRTEFDVFLGILKEIIEKHQANFNKDDIRDFIDAFLAEMEERGPNDDSFNVNMALLSSFVIQEMQLLQYIRDLFEAGTGTTSSTLTWGLLALMNYPECQKKIADEIEQTLGDSGIPSMKHREQMNYTCAFIHELMRHRTLVPMSLMHKTNRQAFINGYTIPKDTTVIPNIWSVHYDPDLFENPEAFRPERFLDSDGKFVKSNHVIPFSVGPRHCLGEQLARMEVFIFLTGIVQKLKILPDPSNPPPPLTSGFLPMLSTYEPPEFCVVLEKR